ncbi:NAD-dependent epimerase/dehydratase family protein [Anthocerotibacter panamensis]|uniref:NAD-dependent epimerase/dehydratase family protein n=1 Tax=Anthocerotibacter panamensis TaxID=2857077 RepID=UPI001C405492|nr:NAD-dependent epimerase/dehydratase family protein [Anthocerotibacter panamensis]
MTFWNGKRVLVTGGASFIGSHLVDKLVTLGAQVRVADDLSSGRLENLHESLKSIELHQGDLRDRDFTRTAMMGSEVVFHLAACHGGRGFIDTHPADCASNLVLDGMVIDQAWRSGVERVCFASSACVYPVGLQAAPVAGKTTYLKEEWANPFKEGCAHSDGEYGWAKLMGEMTLQAYYKQYGLKSVSCRLFTAYGERENETHAVIALIAKAFVRMDPYEIWGDGQQDRNFTYVGDIVDGMIRAAECVEDASAVNIGTAEHIKIIDAVRLIFDLTGFTAKALSFDTTKPVGVYSRAADLTRTRERLDWEPGTSFAEGLERTIRWYYSTRNLEKVSAQLGVLLTER